jgi:hypothetical protein
VPWRGCAARSFSWVVTQGSAGGWTAQDTARPLGHQRLALGRRRGCWSLQQARQAPVTGRSYTVAALLLFFVLVVIAVAYRRLGPSSSATTSTVERPLQSTVVQLHRWSRPAISTRCSAHDILVVNGPKPPETVSTRSAQAITRSDLLTIC